MKADISCPLLTRKFDKLKVLNGLDLFWLNAVKLKMVSNNIF